MHAEEAHIRSINLFEGKKCFGSVGEGFWHIAGVHKPAMWKINRRLKSQVHYMNHSMEKVIFDVNEVASVVKRAFPSFIPLV